MSGFLGGVIAALTSGPDFVLILGPVEFQGHEIPSSLEAGGDQMMSAHKYQGGTRTIDTFGPDDSDIGWSGTFTDLEAEPRCQMLDSLRRQGAVLPLIWSTFAYSVVIKTFKFTYERFWQIPYRIELTVLQDLANPGSGADGDSVDGQVNSDAGAAAGNTASLGALSYA